ncbi:hypothetical protein F5Y10DRAFT_287426 [Nemania abortiva]|nr:hypothetical protein F5Y10DRAFT_287426 [Nemania abortiva]
MASSHSSPSSSDSLTIVSNDEHQPPRLTFKLDHDDIVRAENDETLYWSDVHRKTSDADLFHRASSTKERLKGDIEGVFYKLSDSKIRRLQHGRRPSDPEPSKRLKLRLAGRAQPGEDEVTLTDSILIACNDTHSVRKIQAEIDKIEWLKHEEYAPVYVYLEKRIES